MTDLPPPSDDNNPSLSSPSPYHPMMLAFGSIVQCLPFEDQELIAALAMELNDIVMETPGDVSDGLLTLAMQSRVLDTIFNRCIMTAFKDKGFHSQAVLIGLKAQQQCSLSIDRLKKNRLAEEKLLFMRERSERSRKHI
jgi:hypothetical protein